MGSMKLFLVSLVLFFLFTGFLFGSDVSIDYLEGALSYREGNGRWVEIGIGDNLSSSSTVRLSGNGFVEFSTGGNKVTLTKDGMYEMGDLFVKNQKKSSFRQLLGSKFSFLLDRQDSANYTAAAVRGSARNTDFLTWENDEESNLAKGMKLYSEGNYVAARNQFREGSLWEKGAEKRENTFRLAMAENMIGNPRESRKLLASFKPLATDSFFEEYSLYVASLYIESQEYDMAGNVLQSYLDTEPENIESKQAALLLISYVYEGKGKDSEAVNALRQVVSLDSGSDIAKSANLLLK